MIEIGEGTRRARTAFDVICAGEATWCIPASSAAPNARGEKASRTMRLRPSGGAVNVALALAQGGLRVALAAALSDDSQGRALLAKVKAAGVAIAPHSAASFAPYAPFAAPRANLVIAVGTGRGREVVPFRMDDEPPIAIPDAWSAQVLLLSGISPGIAPAAGLCKAARAGRRKGAVVVIDLNARRHAWVGRDARCIRMVLREADVVRCSTADLAALGIDDATARGSMRPNATLIVTHGPEAARATGLFGEIRQKPASVIPVHPRGAGDAFTAAICAELARTGDAGADRSDLWSRAMQRGHEAACAQIHSQ